MTVYTTAAFLPFGSCGNFGLNCVRTISLAEIRTPKKHAQIFQTQKNTRLNLQPKKIQELKVLVPKKYVGPPVTFIPEYSPWGSDTWVEAVWLRVNSEKKSFGFVSHNKKWQIIRRPFPSSYNLFSSSTVILQRRTVNLADFCLHICASPLLFFFQGSAICEKQN